jgi:hypothetical protein
MSSNAVRQITGERHLRIWGSCISAGQTRSVTRTDNRTVRGSVCQTQSCLTLKRTSGIPKVKLDITFTLQQTGWLHAKCTYNLAQKTETDWYKTISFKYHITFLTYQKMWQLRKWTNVYWKLCDVKPKTKFDLNIKTESSNYSSILLRCFNNKEAIWVRINTYTVSNHTSWAPVK